MEDGLFLIVAIIISFAMLVFLPTHLVSSVFKEGDLDSLTLLYAFANYLIWFFFVLTFWNMIANGASHIWFCLAIFLFAIVLLCFGMKFSWEVWRLANIGLIADQTKAILLHILFFWAFMLYGFTITILIAVVEPKTQELSTTTGTSSVQEATIQKPNTNPTAPIQNIENPQSKVNVNVKVDINNQEQSYHFETLNGTSNN